MNGARTGTLSSMESVAAIIMLIVGVGIGTLSLIFVGVMGGQVYQQVEPDLNAMVGTSTNETFTPINGSTTTLTYDDIMGGSLTLINYSAGGEVAPLTSFTIDYDDGTLLLTNNTWNNTQMNATYNYGPWNITGGVKNAVHAGFVSLTTTGSYLPIIVLAVIIFLVLGLVMGMGMVAPKSTTYGGAL